VELRRLEHEPSPDSEVTLVPRKVYRDPFRAFSPSATTIPGGSTRLQRSMAIRPGAPGARGPAEIALAAAAAAGSAGGGASPSAPPTPAAAASVASASQVRSIHWFPYDRVSVVNADP